MRACEKTTQTVKKYTNFLQYFLVLFFTNVCILNKGLHKAETILTKSYLLPPKKACRVAVTHRDVGKTHKIDVLVEPVKPAKRKGKKCVFFSGF